MIRARLCDARGLTLVELMSGMFVGLLVMFATLTIADTGIRLQARTTDRLDVTERGRVAMDHISSQLRTRICLSNLVTSLVSATDNRVEFYASYAPASSQRVAVQRRRLTYRPSSSDVLQEVWVASPPTEPPLLPPPVSNTANRTTRIVASAVTLRGTTPFFRYYAYQGTPARADLLLATPLAPTDLTRAAVIGVSFAVVGKGPGTETQFDQQIYNRSPSCDVFR